MYSCIGFKKSYPVDIYIYKKDVYTWSVHKVYTFYISEETLRWPPLFPRGRQHFIHTSYKEKKKKEKEKKKEKRSMLPEIKRARLASTFLPSVQLVRLSEIRVVWTDGEGQDRCRLCLHSQKKKRILPMLKSKAPQTQNTSEKHKRALTVRRGVTTAKRRRAPGLTADTPARPR